MTLLPDGVEPPSDWKHNLQIAWEEGYLAAMNGIGPDGMPDVSPDEQGAWAKGHQAAIRQDDHENQDPELVALVQGGPQ